MATSVASYDDHPAATHSGSSFLAAGSHEGCTSASPTLARTGPNCNSAGNSNTLLLLTPPIHFKGDHSGRRPSPSLSGELPLEVKRKSASLSRDDIFAYISKLERQGSSDAKQRSPSLDLTAPGSIPIAIPAEIHSPTDQNSMSSSAGTFYDCISSSSDANSSKDPQKLTEEINLMCALMVAQGGEMTNDISDLSSDATFSDYYEAERSSFASKALPSSQATDYLQHFQLYMSKSHDDAREAAFGSGSELTEIETSLSGQILNDHYQKKKNSIKDALSTGELIQQSKWYSSHGVSGSLDLIDSLDNYHRFPDLVTTVPLPLLELTRYLLVEVSHFISPSHFYLIVNDEKCGSNAFEDFLESFQNFYKSLEYLLEEEQHHHLNGFNSEETEVAEDSEWKLYFTSPPHSVSIGSHFAGYMDEEYEWRRIQVLHFADTQVKSTASEKKGDLSEVSVVARDVDSGHSSTIGVSALRPLSEEFGSIPAFAIRSSLAYLYPRAQRSPSTSSVHPEDTATTWSEECCRLFQTLTYDQILTASIIEIQREDLTDTELAQVLLWCSGENQEDEIFINRKLIELNFAANVAENDQWLLRSNESMNCASSRSSSQLIKQLTAETIVEATVEEVAVPPEPLIPPITEEIIQKENNSGEVPTTKKKKLKKTMSKKKKDANQPIIAIECEGNDSKEDASVGLQTEVTPTVELGEPNVLLSESSSTTRKYACSFDAVHSNDHLPLEFKEPAKPASKPNELFYFTVTFALISLYFTYLINAF